MSNRIGESGTRVGALLLGLAIGCGGGAPAPFDVVIATSQLPTSGVPQRFDVHALRTLERKAVALCADCYPSGLSPDRRFLLVADAQDPAALSVVSSGGGRQSVAGAAYFGWSPDGAHLAYATADGAAYIASPGAHYRVPVFTGRGSAALAWAPDSHQVAFTVAEGVVVADVRGGAPVELPAVAGGVKWAPDSRHLAASTLVSVQMVDVAGGNAVTVAAGQQSVLAYGWSPDGAWFAFTGDQGGGTPPTLVSPDGSNIIPLDGDSSGPAAWSPTEARFAFAGGTGDAALTIWSADGMLTVPVDGQAGASPESSPVWFVSWSPDGSKILYGAVTSFEYWAVIDARDGRELTRFLRPANPLTWSPDGSRLLVADQRFDGTARISVVDATGSSRVEVVPAGESAVWLPDGKHVATIGGGTVSIASADGSSPPVQVFSLPDPLGTNYLHEYRSLQW